MLLSYFLQFFPRVLQDHFKVTQLTSEIVCGDIFDDSCIYFLYSRVWVQLNCSFQTAHIKTRRNSDIASELSPQRSIAICHKQSYQRNEKRM
jgi:hypothetical protein